MLSGPAASTGAVIHRRPPPGDARWAAAWVHPVLGAPIRDGAVAIEGGRIAAVGTREALARTHPHLPEADLGRAVLAPGLVDAHCHLEWALLGGLLPSAPFHRWLAAMIARRGRMAADGALDAAARLGALRCLRHGTTTVADSGPTGAGVHAATELGLRAHVLLEVVGRDRGADARRRADEAARTVASLRRVAGPLVTVGTAPHAIYSVGPELWTALLSHDALRDGPWGCHLAESPAERDLVASGGGALGLLFATAGIEPAVWAGPPGDSPVVRADRAGVLRDGLLAAHCVQLGPGDAALLGARGVRPVLCPTSNAHLLCGTAPLDAFRRAGVRPALGTDSPASAGPFDLRAEARMLAATQGVAGDACTPDELLRMATADGAAALGRDDVGALIVGRRADLAAVVPPPDAEDPPAAGFLHPLGRVVAVAVNGAPRIWDGEVLGTDTEAITTAATDARRRLC